MKLYVSHIHTIIIDKLDLNVIAKRSPIYSLNMKVQYTPMSLNEMKKTKENDIKNCQGYNTNHNEAFILHLKSLGLITDNGLKLRN